MEIAVVMASATIARWRLADEQRVERSSGCWPTKLGGGQERNVKHPGRQAAKRLFGPSLRLGTVLRGCVLPRAGTGGVTYCRSQVGAARTKLGATRTCTEPQPERDRPSICTWVDTRRN